MHGILMPKWTMAVLAFRQEWSGFDRDGPHQSPFPPRHGASWGGSLRDTVWTSRSRQDCLMSRTDRWDTIGKRGEIIGSWIDCWNWFALPWALVRYGANYWVFLLEKILSDSDKECDIHDCHWWVGTSGGTGPWQDLEAEKGGKLGGRQL